ncbi:HAD hydrolase-like protein [Brooklawnia sp.]|uniref:HAD family hydrolase n=1 Tax=Brooklawnia sp. TaxID=2699740 RepID=UPI00311F2AC5
MNSTPRWPVVLFDFDGTLLNTIDGIVASYTYAWQTVSGRQVTRLEILPWIGRTLEDVFAKEDLVNAAELEAVYLEHNAATIAAAIRRYDGISQLLQEMVDAGIRTGIVTAKRRNSVIPNMKLAGLPAETVLACAADDTDRHKPDPAPLLMGLAALNASVAGSLYVGDAIFDLQAAAAAGMDGIGVTWGAGAPDQLRAQPHVAVVDTVAELGEQLLG